jgi:3-oxoacyl-[acyl-carrier protein] reductase
MTVLAGKGALVTGGSRGIGAAIVERLARDGAAVTFSYVRDVGAAERVAAAVAASGGQAWAEPCDLADGAQVAKLFDAAERHTAGLDIVVNNAAVAVVGLIAETTDEQYDAVMNTNAKGTFVAMREAARRLRDNGRLITISTINTANAEAGISLYAGSKAAVEQFSVVAAHELGPRGITVNVVSPGATDTDLLHGNNDPADVAQLPALTPLGRLGQPADIADVVAFLAGPDGRWMTGQNLRATGGLQ